MIDVRFLKLLSRSGYKKNIKTLIVVQNTKDNNIHKEKIAHKYISYNDIYRYF